MYNRIKFVVFSIVILSLILSSCGNVDVYQEPQMVTSNSVTPVLPTEFITIPGNIQDPTIEEITLTVDDMKPVIEQFKDLGYTPHIASTALVVPAARQFMTPADCGAIGKITDQIVRHALDPYRSVEPNVKWAGAAIPTLERLFEAMKNGQIDIRMFIQSPAGDSIYLWFQWFDPVKQKTREIALLIGEGAKQKIGTIFPMGEPAVISIYGSLQEYVIKKAQEIAMYNGHTASPDAVILISKTALELLGGGFALGMGYKLLTGVLPS